MKKLLLALVILATAFSVPAVSVKTGIGTISSLGVSFSTGRWDFSADVRSSFPVLPLAYPEARKLIDGDFSFSDWYGYSCGLFIGGGMSASYRIINSEKHILSAGLTAVAGHVSDREDGVLDILPDYEHIIVAALEVQLQYTFNINSRHSLFFSCGFPFMGWLSILGVPGNNNAYTISSFFFIPGTFREIETNGGMPGVTRYAVLAASVMPVKIGYIYTF